MDTRIGLDDMGKRKFLPLPGLERRPVGRPARSQSLYRVRYRGSLSLTPTGGKYITHYKLLLLLLFKFKYLHI
jgi:hypothetical protein